jgi:hypothetical protein
MGTNYAGIDYSSGLTNIDNKTSIRFGVIHSGEVGQVWYDESEPVYGLPVCPGCGYEYKTDREPIKCPNCGNTDFDMDMIDPIGFKYIGDGYRCFQSQDDPDIFVEKSPYFTYAQFCSPCAPGAVHLENPLSDGKYPSNKGYCFGHDWFESGKAPYKVYDVKTGREIKAD